MNTVEISGIVVADAGPDEVVAAAVAAIRPTPSPAPPRALYALHIGGLNHARDRAFVTAMNGAHLTYADGASVVLLARLAGARRVARSSTTDVGVAMLRAMQAELGQPLRIAVLGGPPGLAERAGAVLVNLAGVTLCHSTHGFHEDYDPVLAEIAAARADVLVVGMGMPREALWTERHQSRITARVVVTCGGWLGFLAGTESRAPLSLQRLGLEWTWRLAQQPRRLASRYARGVGTVVVTGVRLIGARARRRDRGRG